MNKKMWYAITGLVIGAMLLASCAPAATPVPTEVPTEAATVAPTEAATEAATTAPTEAATAAATEAATTAPTAALRTPEQAALDAAGGKQIGGKVSVVATWGGSEQDAFMAMLKPFETATGITVDYTGTRDLNAVLTTRVTAGNPPDLAGLPGPGQMAQFAQQGKLVDLSTILDMNTYKSQYSQTWVDLGTVNGKLVGVFMKAAVKGLIWYDPTVWQSLNLQVPKTWDDMMNLSSQLAAQGKTPWCVAVYNGAASGWPGTDWLEDIVLRQSGADVYNQWWQGKLAWTSPQIKQAWQTWGKVVADPKMLYGGTNRTLSTDFSKDADPLFTNPPGCYLEHQASFMSGFIQTDNPSLKAGTDYNFFPFPAFDATAPSAVEMAGDLFGMFNDTPQAEALIRYIVTPEAQSIWMKLGGALSPNQAVPLSVYPDDLTRSQAQMLTSAQVAVFDASDMMPDAMNTAFWKAVLSYIQDPTSLDSILANLDTVQKDAYK